MNTATVRYLTVKITYPLLFTTVSLLASIFVRIRPVAAADYDCTISPGEEGYDALKAGACGSVGSQNQKAIFSNGGVFQTIVNTLLFIVGAVSVVMIIVGGLRFIFSRGDPQQAASARNTVMYSIIGLVVAVLAWAIVNWLLSKLYGTPAVDVPDGVDRT